jgi:hypothetical protein
MTSQVNVEFDVDESRLSRGGSCSGSTGHHHSFKQLTIFQPGPRHAPSVFNAKRADNDVYATGDLLLPHPEKPDYWKYYGRTDDQIVHNTGEKVHSDSPLCMLT